MVPLFRIRIRSDTEWNKKGKQRIATEKMYVANTNRGFPLYQKTKSHFFKQASFWAPPVCQEYGKHHMQSTQWKGDTQEIKILPTHHALILMQLISPLVRIGEGLFMYPCRIAEVWKTNRREGSKSPRHRLMLEAICLCNYSTRLVKNKDITY